MQKGVKKVQPNALAFRKEGKAEETWRRFRKSKLAMVGLVTLSVVLLFALFAGVVTDYEEDAITHKFTERFLAPSWEHPFGTDDYGRDIFSRVLFGSRVSLTIGFTATLFSAVIASTIGSLVAYYGGRVDDIVMRIMDMLMGIPTLLLAIAISASLGPGVRNLIIALTISQIPGFTRVTRSAILNIVDMEYVEAAKSYGCSSAYIIAKHILPNAIGTVIVQTTMSVATQILNTAALSFLGLGQQPPAPELGSMLSDAKSFMRVSMYGVLFPGLTIATIALSLNLVGDGLRDALDPKLKN